MDLMRARVALRERPFLDVLDLALRFCAANGRAYARLSLVVLVPGAIASWVAARAVGWWLGWISALTLGALAQAPFVVLASRLVFADRVRVREALAIPSGSLLSLAGVRVAQLAAFGGSALLVGLPWLWIGTLLLFGPEVVLLERGGVAASLGRAHRIANAHFGTAFLAMALQLLAPWGAAALADVAGRELLSSMLQIKPPGSMFADGGSWLALAGWWASLPLLATARFFLYLDVRTRTEGWDIQTRFAAIAARSLSPQAGEAP
jgi:hypothetical protein